MSVVCFAAASSPRSYKGLVLKRCVTYCIVDRGSRSRTGRDEFDQKPCCSTGTTGKFQ